MERSSERSFGRLVGARRALLQCLYSASQLSELCALFGAPCLYRTGAPLSTLWVVTPMQPPLKRYTDRCRGRTKFRQTIHLSVAEIKSFSQLSSKKQFTFSS